MAIKYEDVLALARAGFTASQIAAMAANPAPDPEPVQEPEQEQEQEQEQEPEQEQEQDPLEQILTQLRINALNASQQPPAQSVDDILAEVINPPAKGGK